MDSLGHYDLIVIGGGIARLYCLYYCLHAPAGMRTALFEAADRIEARSESELMRLTPKELEELRRHGRHGERSLWEQGLWNVPSDVLSPDAIKYIANDGSFFHVIHENPSAAGRMLTWVTMLQMSPQLRGVQGSMERITERMLGRVRDKGIEVHLNHPLLAATPRGRRVTLAFNISERTADHVILAVPPYPLQAVHGLPGDIRALLHAVLRLPLLKCFFGVKDP